MCSGNASFGHDEGPEFHAAIAVALGIRGISPQRLLFSEADSEEPDLGDADAGQTITP